MPFDVKDYATNNPNSLFGVTILARPLHWINEKAGIVLGVIVLETPV